MNHQSIQSAHIRCALAGLGRIAVSLEDDPLREKPASHSGAIQYNRESALVGGADPEQERREAFRKKFPQADVFDSTLDMIQDVKPHILHITCDTDSHMQVLKDALDHKIPVIVCEKPLADSYEEASALVKDVDQSNSRILVNHERRFSRDYQEVRGLIRDKAFGSLLSISARLYMGKTRPVSQILYHDGTHMLDILRFLCASDLEILSSVGDPYAKGGQLHVLAKASDTMIAVDISGGRDHLVFELDLSFEKGRIRVGNGVYELWKSEESPYYTGFRSLNQCCNGWEGRTAYFSSMMNHALELYKNPGRKSESSFQDGLKVLELIQEILKPHQRGDIPNSSEE